MLCIHCHPYPPTHLQDKLGIFPELLLRPVVKLVPHAYGDFIWGALLRAKAVIHLAKWRAVKSSDYVGKRMFLWRAAEERGWQVERLFFVGKGTTSHRIRKGEQKLLVDDFLPMVSSRRKFHPAIDDKETMRCVFADAGIPVPRGGAFWKKKSAIAFATELGECVIKPRDGSLSKHAMVRPTNFAEAVGIVKQVSPSVIVEEFISGPVFRATTVHGRFVAATRRVPKSEDDKVVMAAGAKMVDVTDGVHKKNRELFEHAASLCGGAIIGFDIISKNLSDSWDEQESFSIIEVNSFPNFDMHHAPNEGESRDVAGTYWDGLELDA
ncbi:MAG: hypothetical protein O2877_02740 [bacterium]|nr:hypothetical protein [bacterium]